MNTALNSARRDATRLQPSTRCFKNAAQPVWIMAILLLVIPLVGCGTDSEETASQSPATSGGSNQPAVDSPDEASAESSEDAADSPAVEDGASKNAATDASVAASIQDWDAIQKSIAASGKPTVLDVWSLSCEPCMREFPGLVQLHKKYGDAIDCISVNTDYDGRKKAPPESYADRVAEFLHSVSARTQNYIASTPNEELYGDLGIASIPAVIIYDSEGNEVMRFVDEGDTRGFSYEKNVLPFVQEKFALEPADGSSE